MRFQNLNNTFRIFIVSICLLAFGCATTRNFESLPVQSEDFELPYEKLAEKYPEVPVYEKRFRGLSPNEPLAEDLIKVWGNPDSEKTSWSYFSTIGGTLVLMGVLFQNPLPPLAAGGIALLIRPVSPKTYIWFKGKYCIETHIDTSIPNYKEQITSWKWTDMDTAEKISDACKQVQNQEKK